MLGVLACVLVFALSWESWDFANEISTNYMGPETEYPASWWSLPFGPEELAGPGWTSFDFDTNQAWALVDPSPELRDRLEAAPIVDARPSSLWYRPRWALAFATLDETPPRLLDGWLWWEVGDGTWYGRD